MNIRKTVNDWRYIGLDKDKAVIHYSNIVVDNLKMLKTECGMFIAVFMAILLTNLVIKHDIRYVLLLSCGIVNLIVILLLIRGIFANEDIDIAMAGLAVIFYFMTVCYVTAIYLGTFAEHNQVAVSVIALFVFLQMNFDLLPLHNLIITLLAGISFMICSGLNKNFDMFQYDLINSIIAISLGMFASWHKAKVKWENVTVNDKLIVTNYALYHASNTDNLTGLPNRRQTFDLFSRVENRCRSKNSNIACIIMDVDYFKFYNDTYGHPKGDELLKKLGVRLEAIAKKYMIEIGRIGGEEFMAVWEEKDRSRYDVVAEDIRQSIEAMKELHSASMNSNIVTVSIGVYCGPSLEKKNSEYTMADRALYKAKETGRNCCYRYLPTTKQYEKI